MVGEAMRPFVLNGHGRLVFPSNFSAGLDFSVLETFERGIAQTAGASSTGGRPWLTRS